MTPVHRPITAADHEALHRLYSARETAPFLDYEPTDAAGFRPIFDALVEAGETMLVVDGGRVLATYRVHRQTHRCAHVATLGGFALQPDARGSGLAAAVLDAIVARWRAAGVRRLELLVEADNPRAIRFYEKSGFVREGVLRGAFRRQGDADDVDEIAMARRI